jgi:hypothetical protein
LGLVYIGYEGFCLCASPHPCVPLCTPVYPCVPLCTPVYPCVPLCTPVYPCVPLCNPVYPRVPLCTPVYSCAPLCTPAYLCVKKPNKKRNRKSCVGKRSVGTEAKFGWWSGDTDPFLLPTPPRCLVYQSSLTPNHRYTKGGKPFFRGISK